MTTNIEEETPAPHNSHTVRMVTKSAKSHPLHDENNKSSTSTSSKKNHQHQHHHKKCKRRSVFGTCSGGGAAEKSTQDMHVESCHRSSSSSSSHCHSSSTTTPVVVAKVGDVVTLDLQLEPEHGFVPESLFDRTGIVSFVLGWGNYLPGLHELVQGRHVGDAVHKVSMDAGWGRKRDDLIVHIPLERLQRNLQKNTTSQQQRQQSHGDAVLTVGTTLQLSSTMSVLVADMYQDETQGTVVVVDANPPLAGSSYACSFTILNIESLPDSIFEYQPQQVQKQQQKHDEQDSACTCKDDQQEQQPFQAATFALGCFWGAELAFMRVPGVVGTKVGYSQGITRDPTYEEVCTGRTQHREAVMVVYDTRHVSYPQLVQVALDRLASTAVLAAFHKSRPTTTTATSTTVQQQPQQQDDSGNSTDSDADVVSGHELFQDVHEKTSPQYKHGFYYHTGEQQEFAVQELEKIAAAGTTMTSTTTEGAATAAGDSWNRYGGKIELLQASVFYPAEDWHQQYLYKGGQSARKGAKETIRCYG